VLIVRIRLKVAVLISFAPFCRADRNTHPLPPLDLLPSIQKNEEPICLKSKFFGKVIRFTVGNGLYPSN